MGYKSESFVGERFPSQSMRRGRVSRPASVCACEFQGTGNPSPTEIMPSPVWRGGRKTVNGAYRYRYAPYVMPLPPLAPLALPLGELSPKVTERALQAVLNGDINLCAHAAKIPINISVGKTQNLQSKRCQKCGTLRIIGHPLRLIVLRTIQFNH